MKDLYGVRTGREVGNVAFSTIGTLIWCRQQSLLIFPPPGRQQVMPPLCSRGLLLLGPDQLAVWHREQHVPLTAHVQLLRDTFICSSTVLLHF